MRWPRCNRLQTQIYNPLMSFIQGEVVWLTLETDCSVPLFMLSLDRINVSLITVDRRSHICCGCKQILRERIACTHDVEVRYLTAFRINTQLPNEGIQVWDNACPKL